MPIRGWALASVTAAGWQSRSMMLLRSILLCAKRAEGVDVPIHAVSAAIVSVQSEATADARNAVILP
jgi:hypothetical protein